MSLEKELFNAIQYYFSERNNEKTGNPIVSEEKIMERFNTIIKKCKSSMLDFSVMHDQTLTQKNI